MESNTSLTPQQAFEKKLEEKIRADIGELIPEEALAELVKRAIEKVFFTKGGYYNNPSYSWFEEAVRTALTSQIRDVVTKYMADHKDEMGKRVFEEITKQGPSLLGAMLVSMFQANSYVVSSTLLKETMDHLRSNNPGLQW
jgi:hypothetical protein